MGGTGGKKNFRLEKKLKSKRELLGYLKRINIQSVHTYIIVCLKTGYVIVFLKWHLSSVTASNPRDREAETTTPFLTLLGGHSHHVCHRVLMKYLFSSCTSEDTEPNQRMKATIFGDVLDAKTIHMKTTEYGPSERDLRFCPSSFSGSCILRAMSLLT